MARLNRGPNGPFSGKVGSVIGSSWRGIYYIKGLPKTRKKKKRSIGQLEQQGRFTFAVRFLTPIKGYLDQGFSKINPKASTGYNMALSHMLLNSIKGTFPDLDVDYSKVQFSQGKTPLPETVSVSMDGILMKLNWSTESVHKFAHADDRVELLVYCTKDKQFQIYPGHPIRSDGYLELSLDDQFRDAAKHVFIFMVNKRDNHWSNTLYVGQVQIAT